MRHTMQEDFEHFLYYSGQSNEPPGQIEKLRVAFDAAWKQEKDLHELCVAAVEEAVAKHISHHTSFISAEDNVSFGLKEGGKIPKVTIEWVDASEADPKNFEAA